MFVHRDRCSDAAGRQKPTRRFAVGRGSRLGASSALAGLPGPASGPLLPSHLPRPVPITSSPKGRP